ncbi:Cro/Cl family transcriptional regulator [Burkholderia sp. FL-7-2-10-S1-D7]|uniref:cable pilus major pilin CblA n=1 Tax=Burkholderia sp. FL-7-2-10-S1-D7 TaxID=1637866 RepID=UPI00075A5D10|nr:cable pilus major pilin CblA [Burkholderia sp. FL-7-2-10-S1-D7]KVF77994.1 Cro/Cl family transcriptional regulator [Burkholderia sp. FL-7-2-10-S1-D7]
MLKFIPITAAALMSMSAFAVQKDITVTANVDSTVEMLSADGSALPTTMQMQYLPGVGLQTASVNTKMFTNDKSHDLLIRLTSDSPSLKNQTKPGAPEIPLKVSLGEMELSSAPTKLIAQNLFPGDLAEGSVALPLSIAQATPEVVEAGSYQGLVSVILTQDAASGG